MFQWVFLSFQTCWTKKGKLRWFQDLHRGSKWIDCQVELTQESQPAVNNNHGSFTLQYTHHDNQKVLTVNYNKITWVRVQWNLWWETISWDLHKVILCNRWSFIKGTNVWKCRAMLLQKWSCIRGESLISLFSLYVWNESENYIQVCKDWIEQCIWFSMGLAIQKGPGICLGVFFV